MDYSPEENYISAGSQEQPLKMANENLPVKKIIRNGNMNVKTDNVEQFKVEVDSLVKKYNAYYLNENIENTEYAYFYNLKIKIPAARFDLFIHEIEQKDVEITFKNIGSSDVTEEYIDVETRLQNKRNYLKRYNELLEKAKINQ
ncbi:MAG: DUF4349 domain-containing protein [Bacteroidales bacterium]|nr:DUF4349 domain-containing protein [Bacteroidales bacterium]